MPTTDELKRYTYTSGAHIYPLPISVDNEIKWVWAVSEFEDDTFCDGTLISPNEVSDTLEGLIEDE